MNQSKGDTEDMPICRPSEPCYNCRAHWDKHNGWACIVDGEVAPTKLSYSKCHATERYLTSDMPDFYKWAGRAKKAEITLNKTLLNHEDFFGNPKPADWKVWRNDAPGCCPCGVIKSQCDYHK
jgi:hypothetical protein